MDFSVVMKYMYGRIGVRIFFCEDCTGLKILCGDVGEVKTNFNCLSSVPQ